MDWFPALNLQFAVTNVLQTAARCSATSWCSGTLHLTHCVWDTLHRFFCRCSRKYGGGGNNTDKRLSPRSWLALWRCLLFGAEQVAYDDFFRAVSGKQHGESRESEANTTWELQSCWWFLGFVGDLFYMEAVVTKKKTKNKTVPRTRLSWSDPLCFFHVKRQHLYNRLQTLLCLPLSLSEPVYNAWQKVINDSAISIYEKKKKKEAPQSDREPESVCIPVSCLGFHMKEVTHTHTHTHTHTSLDSVLQQLSHPLLHDSSLVTQLLTHPDELTAAAGGETERKNREKSKEKRTWLVHEDNIYYVLVFSASVHSESWNTENNISSTEEEKRCRKRPNISRLKSLLYHTQLEQKSDLFFPVI